MLLLGSWLCESALRSEARDGEDEDTEADGGLGVLEMTGVLLSAYLGLMVISLGPVLGLTICSGGQGR